jgi:hypothetical protein
MTELRCFRVVSRRGGGLLLGLLSFFLVSASRVVGVEACASECGFVSGSVRVIFGSSLVPLPGVKLVFFDTDWRGHEAHTDVSGEYQVSLPYGNYSAEVVKDGNCSVQRPPFRVSAGERLSFAFTLVPCVSDARSPEYHEESIPADPATGRPEVRLAFGDHTSTNLGEVYRSFLPQHSQIPFLATLAADTYTVRAMAITLHREPMYFVAEGDVEVSDGHTSQRVERARLSFRRSLPVLEIEH